MLATADTAPWTARRRRHQADARRTSRPTRCAGDAAGQPGRHHDLRRPRQARRQLRRLRRHRPCGKVAAALLDRQPASPRSRPATRSTSRPCSPRSPAARPTPASSTRTDAVAAGDQVTAVDDPARRDEITTYPIAPLTQSKKADLAQQFVDLVHSATRASRCSRTPASGSRDARSRTRARPAPPACCWCPRAVAAALLVAAPGRRCVLDTPWGRLPRPAAHRGGPRRAVAHALASRRHGRSPACCSARRWPGCWPASTSPAGPCCGPRSRAAGAAAGRRRRRPA